jgi:DnaK suppressor protein
VTDFEQNTKRRLETELAEVNQQIASLKREPRAEELETSGDNTPFSEDADAMQKGEAQEISAALLSQLIERAASLDQALHRLQQGAYGICTRCERRIHRQRLEALPEAAFCLNCQAELERARPRGEPKPQEWREAQEIYQEKARNQ